MKVGFTGTRHGCTEAQLAALRSQIESLAPTEFHHGDCEGADAQAHEIAAATGAKVVIHPSDLTTRRAYCQGAARVLPALQPLIRNRDIVRATEILLACPNSFTQERRSGTWFTVNNAREAKRKIIYIWPDGRVEVENAY